MAADAGIPPRLFPIAFGPARLHSTLGAGLRVNFSSLRQGQVAVVQAERGTGIVLTPEGRRRLGSGESFRAFESFADARTFAKGVVDAKPEVECGLYDCTGAHLERIVSAG